MNLWFMVGLSSKAPFRTMKSTVFHKSLVLQRINPSTGKPREGQNITVFGKISLNIWRFRGCSDGVFP